MNKKRALILTGGFMSRDYIKGYLEKESFDLIIAVDKGLVMAKELNIQVQYIVGDFDSVPGEVIGYYRNKAKNEGNIIIKEYNPQKDDTDTEIAINLCINEQVREIVILGATGNRIDHMLANIQLLYLPLMNGINAFIIDEYNKIYLIKEENILYKNDLHGPYISLLPLTSEVTGITLSGFKYPLYKYNMHLGKSIGISNEMVEDKAKIVLESGILIVVEARD